MNQNFLNIELEEFIKYKSILYVYSVRTWIYMY